VSWYRKRLTSTKKRVDQYKNFVPVLYQVPECHPPSDGTLQQQKNLGRREIFQAFEISEGTKPLDDNTRPSPAAQHGQQRCRPAEDWDFDKG
jgi:hypothetical protein